MAEIIDGKALSAALKEDIAVEAKKFEDTYGRKVGLAVVKVGNNPASEVYVRNKIIACEKVGVRSFSHNLPEDENEADLLALIDALNADPEVDGILVQLPLPAHINEKKVLARIRPEKDADGFHVMNAGGLMLGLPCTKPCTPAGIIELIKSTGAKIAGKATKAWGEVKAKATEAKDWVASKLPKAKEKAAEAAEDAAEAIQ